MGSSTNARKVLKQQFKRIKEALLISRNNPEEFNKVEYAKLNKFLILTTRELTKQNDGEMVRPLPAFLEVTLKIKAKRFILDNLPNYSKRLIK